MKLEEMLFDLNKDLSIEEALNSTILTEEKLADYCKKLGEAKVIGFDYETKEIGDNGHIPMTAEEVYGISIASDNGIKCYIPFRHNGVKCLDKDLIISYIYPVLNDKNIMIVAHNIVYEILMSWVLGMDLSWKLDSELATCTQNMSFYDNENRKNHKLSHVSKSILKVEVQDFGDLTEDTSYINLPVEVASKYAIVDSIATILLYYYFYPKLEKQKLLAPFYKVEMPYTMVLAYKKWEGIDVNTDLLDLYEERLDEEITELKTKLLELAGREVNFNSPKQLGDLFFAPEPEGFGQKVISYTPTGNPQTSKDVIEFLSNSPNEECAEFCRIFLRYRKLTKVQGTYVRGLKDLIYPDKRVRGNFNQTVAVTGRLSSSAPNLQNQPTGSIWEDKYYIGENYTIEELKSLGFKDNKEQDGSFIVVISDDLEDLQEMFPYHYIQTKDEDTGEELVDENGRYILVHRKVRDLYYNRDGNLLVADYSQMELRIMAHFSNDENLLAAFKEGKDIHRWVAALSLGIDENDVTGGQRSDAKAVGFGTIYGKTPYGFTKDWYSDKEDLIIGYDPTGSPLLNENYIRESEEYIKKFFRAFPGVKEYIEKCEQQCFQNGYVRTLIGRKRRLPGIYSSKLSHKNKAKRQAVNTKIQGSAGDYIKMAQILLFREFHHKGIKQRIQVHDEIIASIPYDMEEEVGRVKEVMENVVPLNVPIETEPMVVKSWGMMPK